MKIQSLPALLLILLLHLFSATDNGFAQLKVANIFSDNMVIQRDQIVTVWGSAKAGQSVAVTIANGEKTPAIASSEGTWFVNLSPMKATDKPFEIVVETLPSEDEATEKIRFSNVVCGEVWVCSGQSNMEWSVAGSGNPVQEIANANFPLIRHVKILNQTSLSLKNDAANTAWQVCSPDTAGDFTAVGYYFGRKLHQELDVPIGLINSSWGGTIIEAWISGDSLKTHPDFKNVMGKIEGASTDEVAARNEQAKFEKWADNFSKLADDRTDKWEATDLDDSSWNTIKAPGHWENQGYADVDGVGWYRRSINVPASWAGKPMTLALSQIDDIDETYVNGSKVGSMTAWNAERNYQVPADLVKAGPMTIAIRVYDGNGGGGIHSSPENVYAQVDGESKIELAGDWKFKLSTKTAELGPRPQVVFSGPNHPTVLYNAMIHPLHPEGFTNADGTAAIVQFNLKGAIWYQGESNAGRAYQYRSLMPLLIQDWRNKWGNELSFYWVQLANFTGAATQPDGSDWAELREAQSMTLSLPKTGQAIAIDIGDANDIHPKNKQDVGLRLALNALAKDFGKDIEFSGPVYISMAIEGSGIRLRFEHAEGLTAKGGELRRFEIAGEDQKFVWATAKIEGDTVLVSSDAIEKPVAVRYAWSTNPAGCNLYNSAGLPASPFRTDSWKGVTQY